MELQQAASLDPSPVPDEDARVLHDCVYVRVKDLSTGRQELLQTFRKLIKFVAFTPEVEWRAIMACCVPADTPALRRALTNKGYYVFPFPPGVASYSHNLCFNGTLGSCHGNPEENLETHFRKLKDDPRWPEGVEVVVPLVSSKSRDSFNSYVTVISNTENLLEVLATSGITDFREAIRGKLRTKPTEVPKPGPSGNPWNKKNNAAKKPKPSGRAAAVEAIVSEVRQVLSVLEGAGTSRDANSDGGWKAAGSRRSHNKENGHPARNQSAKTNAPSTAGPKSSSASAAAAAVGTSPSVANTTLAAGPMPPQPAAAVTDGNSPSGQAIGLPTDPAPELAVPSVSAADLPADIAADVTSVVTTTVADDSSAPRSLVAPVLAVPATTSRAAAHPSSADEASREVGINSSPVPATPPARAGEVPLETHSSSPGCAGDSLAPTPLPPARAALVYEEAVKISVQDRCKLLGPLSTTKRPRLCGTAVAVPLAVDSLDTDAMTLYVHSAACVALLHVSRSAETADLKEFGLSGIGVFGKEFKVTSHSTSFFGRLFSLLEGVALPAPLEVGNFYRHH
jgi:hypothetical protein